MLEIYAALLEMFVNSDSLFRQYEAQVEDF